MSPAEVLAALEAAGVRLSLADGKLKAEVPDPAPAGVPDLLAEVKRQRPAVLALLVDRRLDEVAARLPEGSPAARWCPHCGFSWWFVTPRADLVCMGCAALEAGRKPTCGACGREDGWADLAGGRKACGCSGSIALAQKLADVLTLHLAETPRTTHLTVAEAADILVGAAAEVLQ